MPVSTSFRSPLTQRPIRGLGKAALLCASLFQLACSGVATKPDSTVEAAAKDETPSVAPVYIDIAAVGDIMLGTDYPKRRLAENPSLLLQSAAPVLQQADVSFGNLEGVLLNGGEARKRCPDPSRCYVFRSPESYAQILADAGFDLLSLANNHARDFHEEGRDTTMRTLDAVGILHSGRDGDVARWEHAGLKMAMIAFAPFIGAHDMLDLEYGHQQISQLAAETDVLLVSFHGGAEGADRTAIPFTTEYFHGEDRGDVVAFAHMAIDAGADLVLGHGPHVPRALELYRGRLIAYSLGNFATHWGINVRGVNGLAPVLVAKLDQEGRFVGGQLHSFRQQRPHGPLLDPSHQVALTIRSLTRETFPNTPLLIGETGHITVSQPVVTHSSLGASP